ncbi:Sortase family protein [Streptomyces sp. YIM 121038]|uniref:class E sortase n=1 Tax=Streptomyces sp. YIM 121038 TaxID=2136401 RepID=UPI001110BF24|nr:class E sortase [Streptomyces sp. YIM 121038]QCX76835.1 Sortase family protein [Streptomyces sp. YIM 121038]
MVRVVTHGAPGERGSVLARSLWCTAELLVTLGLVLLLLVVHQLWWTNRQARAGARAAVERLEEEWGHRAVPDAGDGAVPGAVPKAAPDPAPDAEDGPAPDAEDDPAPDAEGGPGPASRPHAAYAILRVPRLGLSAPVAEGIGKRAVLDKGYVGHYPRTARPGRAGNFALAGHRNTHGEPFRHLDRLRAGDRITVETRAAVYTYAVVRTLARTTPYDSGVLRAVPRSDVRPGYGFREPGYYLTLTTCTPAYTSTYRLVVWGKLRSMAPR